ncbi:MAG: hypothetical protein ACK5QC_08200 [Bacteroidota bacterium]
MNRGNLFSRVLFGFLVLKCCFWLYNFNTQFSNVLHINNQIPSIGTIKDFAFLLSHLSNDKVNLIVIIFVLLSSVSFIFVKSSFIWVKIIIWLAVVNLHNFAYAGLSGGDYLLNQFLFFNCFIGFQSISKFQWLNDLKMILHNLSIISCIILLCLVYVTSGLSKVAHEDWQNGLAISFILKSKHYSLPWLYDKSIHGWINYIVIFFQLTFCLGISFKASRKYYLFAGLTFHLLIFVVMGLFNFSALMLIPYLLLFDIKLPFLFTNKKAGK